VDIGNKISSSVSPEQIVNICLRRKTLYYEVNGFVISCHIVGTIEYIFSRSATKYVIKNYTTIFSRMKVSRDFLFRECII
jgi:hypothetical protein